MAKVQYKERAPANPPGPFMRALGSLFSEEASRFTRELHLNRSHFVTNVVVVSQLIQKKRYPSDLAPAKNAYHLKKENKMQIGVMINGSQTDELIEKAKQIESQGFHSLWMANFIGHDLETLHAMGLIAYETESIKLGTAVVPIYSHHPFALAHQAISIQQTSQGRFTLGIGLSHPFIVNEWLGLSNEKPIAQIREYLSILRPLLNRESVKAKGNFFSAVAEVHVPDVERVPLLVAAMGPQMLKIAGKMADGTVTYLTGLHTLASHIIPNIRAAVPDKSHASPRIVASGLPIALVKDKDLALATIAEQWAGYADVPTYRAMFDREGVAGAEGVALVGDAATLKTSLHKLEDMGVTEFVASVAEVEVNSVERTLDFLASQL